MEEKVSDSSSVESSSEEMETDSDKEINSNQIQQKAKSEPFIFSFLQDKHTDSKQKLFDAYLYNKNHFSNKQKSLLMRKTSEPVPDNFTPWWESFKAIESSGQGEASTAKDAHHDPNLYHSWFDKSSSSENDYNWLSGPKPKSSDSGETRQVEDIDVPSIYGSLPTPKGRRALKKERKELRNKTTGKKWFDMKLPDVDGKTKMDMELLQMRRALDPKRFYKQNDRKGLPKYFQLGTVVDEGTDFYSSRLTKKQRKQTLVEELMADVNIRQYNKKKYEELQQKERTKKFTKRKRT